MKNIENVNIPTNFNEIEDLNNNASIPIEIDRRYNNYEKKLIAKNKKSRSFGQIEKYNQIQKVNNLDFGINNIKKLAKVNKYWNHVDNSDRKDITKFWIKRFMYSSWFRITLTIFFLSATIALFSFYWLYPGIFDLSSTVIILLFGSIFALFFIIMLIYHIFLII